MSGEFPTKPPILQLVSKTPFQHPHVDQRGYILPSLHPKFQNWTARDNLGKMVFEIAQALTMPVNNPPQPFGNNPPNSNPLPQYGSNPNPPPQYSSNPPQPFGNNPPKSNPPPQYGSNNQFGSNSGKTEFEPLPVPKAPTNFPDLQDKSVEELQFLLSDEDGFSLFLEDQEFIKNLKTLREGIMDQNEESASLLFSFFFFSKFFFYTFHFHRKKFEQGRRY